jgi:hypothetical protein
VIIGVSITLVGSSFTAYARVFGSRLCQGTAIVSFLSAWWLLIANLLTYTGQVWIYYEPPSYPYWRIGPLFYPYATILVIGLALLGVTLLLWPSALIATRHLTRQRTLAIASGVLFLIAAHMILLPLPFNAISLLSSSFYWPSIIYYSYGPILVACLVEPASILSAILTYRFRTPK